MTIASGTTPTGGDSPFPEYELEAGLRPPLPRRGRSFHSLSFPFPAIPTPSTISAPSFTVPPPTPASSSNTSSGESSFPTKPHSTHTWATSGSTGSSSSDAHYERMVYDYRVLAQSMHAYRHLSIFRRFGRLSMANLLGYQDELTDLEEALRGLDYQRDSEQQRESRRSLMRRLRESLKHYYEALLLQEQIFTALEPPRPSDARLLGEMAPPYPASCELASPTQTVDEHTDDLVALGGLSDRDSLEKMVGRMMPALFPGRNPSAQDLRSRNMSSRDIVSLFSPFTRRVTRMVIALGTALLMLAPMVLLRFLKSDLWTMVSIAAFTLVLAVMVAVGTRGRGESIVMVIAAYAAVLVVFVQNNGSDCGGKC